MIGTNQLVNGDQWTIVDVAPAAALAEMVAALLEDEGFVAIVRGSEDQAGILTHLGAHSLGTTYVLVPEVDAERALALIADTVTDYEGDELDAAMAAMAFDDGSEAALDDDDTEPDEGDEDVPVG